ncbi:MAG: peptidoglycan DD-metalloendopeptidase family protein [Saprospiraceae bacterium]
MKYIRHLFLVSCSMFILSLAAQEVHQGGGMFESSNHRTCLDELERRNIILENIDNMRALGFNMESETNKNQILSLGWPLRKSVNLEAPGYYLISNFVDHDLGNGIRDYDCGNRTYNGHKGTDIAIWPYPWYKQAQDHVEVIAAQSGVIINKFDGNNDMSCQLNNNSWNAIYIRHVDGSVAWYGHLKKNSVTSKAIGQTVAKGEYLGIVGSSGNSTGPHLHFELYQNSSQTILIDPFGGTCNSLNGNQSWWESQHTYLSPQILDLLIHTCNPYMQDGCPANNDVLCEAVNIQPSETLRFSANFRQQRRSLTTYMIKKPDGTIFSSWNHSPPQAYDYGSYWYWTKTLPNNPQGIWTFEVTHNNETAIKEFNVGMAQPVPSCSNIIYPLADGVSIPTSIEVKWDLVQNATGYKVKLTSNNGNTIHLDEDVGNITFKHIDNLPENTKICVTIIPYNNSGDAIGCPKLCFTTIRSTSTTDNSQISIKLYPVPARDQLIIPIDLSNHNISIYNNLGNIMDSYLINYTLEASTIQIDLLPAGLYFINITGQNANFTYKFIKI